MDAVWKLNTLSKVKNMKLAIYKTLSLTFLAAIALQLSNVSTVRADDDDGGSMAGGGGNTVGDDLYDDYENKGTVQIPAAVIEKYAEPVLHDLDDKIPAFAEELREGIHGLIWYKEPKVLKQNGMCKNGAHTGLSAPIDQVVRACQNKLDVRMEQKWYEEKSKSNPKLVAGLVVHELLVRKRIKYYWTKEDVSEEGLYRMSRDIRSQKLSAEKLKDELSVTGFGTYATFAETEWESLKNKFWKAENEVSMHGLCAAHQSTSLFTSWRKVESDRYYQAVAAQRFPEEKKEYDEAADKAKVYKEEAQFGKEQLARLAEDFCAQMPKRYPYWAPSDCTRIGGFKSSGCLN